MAVERTLVLLKPDCVARHLIGDVVGRFERKGLRIIGLKLIRVSPEMSKAHYAEHVSKPFYPQLEAFITAGPIVALVLEGPEAIGVVRTMLGPTNGRQAAPGTIRGDFGMSRQMNLVHGSDGPDAAKREIGIYFSSSELVGESDANNPWTCAGDER